MKLLIGYSVVFFASIAYVTLAVGAIMFGYRLAKIDPSLPGLVVFVLLSLITLYMLIFWVQDKITSFLRSLDTQREHS